MEFHFSFNFLRETATNLTQKIPQTHKRIEKVSSLFKSMS